MHTPQTSGMPKSRFSAMAEPMTSARSQAQIATSHRIHSTNETGARVVIAAGLREVAAGDDAELRAERLQQDRHQVREQDDAEQRVAELRAAGEVRGPVAGIHVADGHEVAGPGEGEHLAPEAEALGHGDGAVHFLEAGGVAFEPPRWSVGWRRCRGAWQVRRHSLTARRRKRANLLKIQHVSPFVFHGTDCKTRDKRDEPFKYRETGITIRPMWPIVTLLTLYVATAGDLGLEQAGRANRSVLDAIVFYADPPSDVAQFPRDVREELKRYHQRLRAYRPRPRPPQLGSEMTMVYAAREGYERKLVAASTRSGVEQLAQEYVDTLRPCYEWEGFHECPEREAIFAERYLIDHPDTAFAGFLRVLAAHRWLCAAEA